MGRRKAVNWGGGTGCARCSLGACSGTVDLWQAAIDCPGPGQRPAGLLGGPAWGPAWAAQPVREPQSRCRRSIRHPGALLNHGAMSPRGGKRKQADEAPARAKKQKKGAEAKPSTRRSRQPLQQPTEEPERALRRQKREQQRSGSKKASPRAARQSRRDSGKALQAAEAAQAAQEEAAAAAAAAAGGAMADRQARLPGWARVALHLRMPGAGCNHPCSAAPVPPHPQPRLPSFAGWPRGCGRPQQVGCSAPAPQLGAGAVHRVGRPECAQRQNAATGAASGCAPACHAVPSDYVCWQYLGLLAPPLKLPLPSRPPSRPTAARCKACCAGWVLA